MLMLSPGQRDLIRDKGTILGRFLMGLFFFISGIGILLNPGTTADYFMGAGVPFASLSVWLVAALKIVAGGAIIIGKRVGAAAGGLIIFTALATIFGHMSFGADRYFDLTGITKNLAVIGGLLYLMAYGPGGTNTNKLNDHPS